MPINFPEFPPVGFNYTYQSRTYTWYRPDPAELGYWRIVEPGTLGPASTEDINNDTYTPEEKDLINIETPYTDDEYITPKALGESIYMTDFFVGTAATPGGTPAGKSIKKDYQLNLITDLVEDDEGEVIYGHPGYQTFNTALRDGPAGGLTIKAGQVTDVDGQGTLDVKFSLPYATDSRNGIVGLNNKETFDGTVMNNETRTDLVPCMRNLKDVYRVGATGSRLELSFGGQNGRSKHYINGLSPSGLQMQWGTVNVGTATTGTVYFDVPFTLTPFYIGLQHRQPNGGVVVAIVSLSGALNYNKFTWRAAGTKNGSWIDYFALGQCGAQTTPFPDAS